MPLSDKEGVIQDLVWCDSVFRVLDEHLEDDLFGFFRYPSEGDVVHIWLSFLDQIESCLSILRLERKLSADKRIVDHTS